MDERQEKSQRIKQEKSERIKQVTLFLRSLVPLDTSLLLTFIEVVIALNEEKWQTVSSLFDENVTLTTLDSPTTTRGKVLVTEYIQKKIADDQPALIPLPPVNADATTGVVEGIALWEDNDYGQRTLKQIRYKFTFTWHVTEEKWYVLNLWGTPD